MWINSELQSNKIWICSTVFMKKNRLFLSQMQIVFLTSMIPSIYIAVFSPSCLITFRFLFFSFFLISLLLTFYILLLLLLPIERKLVYVFQFLFHISFIEYIHKVLHSALTQRLQYVIFRIVLRTNAIATQNW